MTFNELKKLVKVQKVRKGIYHFSFPNQKELAQTMLRFQEHYESPEFKGKIFTLKEFKKWYSTWDKKPTSHKGFSYYRDWNGFNVPDYIIRSVEDKFKYLTKREKLLLHYCSHIRDEKYYIIATSAEDENNSTFQHELVHAEYYVNREYFLKVHGIAPKYYWELEKTVFPYLLKIGYHQMMLWDEANAYMVNDTDYLEKDGVDLSNLRECIFQLQELYQKTISSLTEHDIVELL